MKVDLIVSMAVVSVALEWVALRVSAGSVSARDTVASVALVVGIAGLGRLLQRRRQPAVQAAARAAVASLFLTGLLGSTLVELHLAWIFGCAPLFVGVWSWERLRQDRVAWGPRHQVVAMVCCMALDWGLRAGTRPVDLPAVPALLILTMAAGLWRYGAVFAPVAFLALIPGWGSVRWTATGPAPDGPDVVLITVDTLRWDVARDLASVRRIAASGRLFEAQATAPWTLPSMATIFTGLDVQNHGAYKNDAGDFGAISTDVATLAQRFAEAGYDTAATAENPFTGPWFGFGRGFAVFEHDDESPWALPGPPLATVGQSTGGAVASLFGLGGPVVGVERRLATADRFLAARRDRPLFLWIHLLDPHRPYRHAWSLDLPWSTRADLAWDGFDVDQWPQRSADVRAAYDHEVAVLDGALDTWLAGLYPQRRGRTVLLTSDHGEAFGEHGGWEHGHSMYQELLAVPIAVSAPVSDGPAGLVDVAPTLLRAAGLNNDGLDGRALQDPALIRPFRSMSVLYGEAHPRAVRLGDVKVIADDAAASVRFDLLTDPGELRGVPDTLLDDFLPVAGAGRGATELSPAVREQLRQLGYLDEE